MSGGSRAVYEQERRDFVRTLHRVGPDAPTLCTEWTARELAIHVAMGETLRGIPTAIGRTVLSRFPLRMVGPVARISKLQLRAWRSRPFTWALGRLEREAPRILTIRSVAAASICELWMHHEDVRRANGSLRRDDEPAELLAALEFVLHYQQRVLRDLLLTVTLPDRSRITAGNGRDELALEGTPGEVMLWLGGRRQYSEATVHGEATAFDRLADLRLAI